MLAWPQAPVFLSQEPNEEMASDHVLQADSYPTTDQHSQLPRFFKECMSVALLGKKNLDSPLLFCSRNRQLSTKVLQDS